MKGIKDAVASQATNDDPRSRLETFWRPREFLAGGTSRRVLTIGAGNEQFWYDVLTRDPWSGAGSGKTPVMEPPPAEKQRGLKGRIIAKKTGEMKEEMESAVALVQQYVPPAPDKMQVVMNAGTASLAQAGPGFAALKIRMELGDFLYG